MKKEKDVNLGNNKMINIIEGMRKRDGNKIIIPEIMMMIMIEIIIKIHQREEININMSQQIKATKIKHEITRTSKMAIKNSLEGKIKEEVTDHINQR